MIFIMYLLNYIKTSKKTFQPVNNIYTKVHKQSHIASTLNWRQSSIKSNIMELNTYRDNNPEKRKDNDIVHKYKRCSIT